MARCIICESDVGKWSPEEIPDEAAEALRRRGLCSEHQLEFFTNLDDIDDLFLEDQFEDCDLIDCLDNEVILNRVFGVFERCFNLL